MGQTTKIEWCDSTLNLLVGCSGCELFPDHCYAAELVGRYAGQKGWPAEFTKPELFLDRLNMALRWSDLSGVERPGKPWLDGRPRMIFVNDLGDTFSPAVRVDQHDVLVPVFFAMAESPHTWLLLTKWPDRMIEFVRVWRTHFCDQWPRNIWLGTSATTQITFNRRLRQLVRLRKSARLFLSIEPMLEPIRFQYERLVAGGIDWVIFGGESGSGARPCDVAGIRAGLQECHAVDVPAFVKQLGAAAFDGSFSDAPDGPLAAWIRDGITDPKGGDWTEWPSELRSREVPLIESANGGK